MTDKPTPNAMPGAEPADTATPEPKTEAPKGVNDTIADGVSAGQAELEAELARLRKIHADESKWEKRAKQNFEDAEKFRQLLKASGVEKSSEFDPQAELTKLRAEIESERTERIRAEVARLKGVDPEDIKGSTEDEMNASADRYLARFQARLEEALKAKTPSAPPASTVTANGKIAGPEQITSRDELAKMSPSDRLKAYQDGRLDGLMGKS